MQPLRIASLIPVLMLSIFLSGSVRAHSPGELFMIWPSLTLDAAEAPYVVYASAATKYGFTVQKFEKGRWVSVGSQGLSSKRGLLPSLTIDATGAPTFSYYSIEENSILPIVVLKFNGNAWIVSSMLSLPASFKNVGRAPALVLIPDELAYMAFFNQYKGGKLSVAKMNKWDWVSVGEPLNISSEAAVNPSLALTATGTPYVAYQDGTHEGRLSVMKFEKNAWISVGSPGFTPGFALFPSLKLSAAGVPFVAFQDAEQENKLSVMKFEKGVWVYAGKAGFGVGMLPSLALSKTGVPYVAYWEYGNTNKGKVVVAKLEGENWVKVESQDTSSALKPSHPNTQ